MEIIQVVGLGLVVTFMILLLKEQKPMFAYILATFAGVFIFITLVGKITDVIQVLKNLAHQANVNQLFLRNDSQNHWNRLYCGIWRTSHT